MKHGIGRKLLSVVLAVMMLVSLLPTAAFADDSAEPIVVNSVVGDSNTGNDTKLADEALVNVGDTNANEGEGEETTTPVSTPVAKIGNTGYATLDDAITAVQNGETIEVNAGEYKLNGSLTYSGKAFTIAAADGADVSFDMSAAVALHGAKITFNNVTFNYKTNGNYIGLQHTDTLVYNKCTINGMVFLYAVNETFNNCTFNQTSADAYNVWTYGAQNVAFNGCTFNCVGRCVLVYNEGAIDKTDLTVENTEFNASAPAEGKAAIEIDTHLMKGGATITVDETTTDEGFAAGSNSGSTLWNDKKQTVGTNKNTTVTVAGETVFEPVATAAVAKIDETEYATLDEALKYLVGLEQENMQPTPKVYALSLLDGTKWDTATPVYWAAGTKSGFAAKLTDALTAAYKANAGKITIVCRPGADVGTMTHGHVADNITIFGNKAYVSGGECDLEVDTYKYNRETGANTGDGSDLNGDIGIIAFQLDNLGVWGQRHTTHTVNVALVDCDSVKNIDVQRVYISGTSGKNMIGVTDCDFETAATAVYSNANGQVTVYNCTFKNSRVPVNINHKADGEMIVDMQKCTFTNCGDAGDWKQFAAPVRFVNSGSGTMETGVQRTTFTGTVGTNGDILLGDGRTGKESNDVSLTVTGTDAKIQAQKPGYYNGNTTDANKKAATEVKSNETLDTSVETLLPAEPEQPVPDGYQEDASGNVTISDEAGLFWFAKQVNAGNNFAGKTVTLANNIALTKAWTPIGIYNDSKTHFKGTFDGQNHTVSGVEVTENRTKGVGFFGKVYTGTIKNLTVEGTITTTNCDYVGGIVGHGYATISNCTFKGNVGSTNTMQVGGIAGSGGFTITNCSVYGNVTAECWAGGIVGNCQDGGAYTNCYVEGVISAERTYWGGGAAGITPVPLYPSQVISSCYSNTVVKVAGEEVNCPIIAAYNNPLDYKGYTGDLKIYDNSWNKQKNSNGSYPIYAEKDGVGGVLVEGKDVSRDNNLVMLEDDLQYVTDLSKVRIMAGSAVTQAQVDALAVASIGTAKYISLAAAIAAANNGDTVTLLKNVTENVEIAKEKNLTLDLNGYTLNGGTGTAKAALSNLGTITIQDTSAAKTGTIKRDDNGTTGETSYYVIRNQGTMTIESGTVINNSGYKQASSIGSMNGSSLICNGDCDEGGTLTIKGGTFTQNNFIAIKNGALGVLNVSGGTISSDHSAIQNWFKADITGGEIKGQLWTDAYIEGESVGETTIGGNAKFTGEIVMDIYGSVAPKLAITGGDLDVTSWRITSAAANAGAKPAVSGGTFSSAVPAEYCAAGFIPTANADGTYGVKEGSYVAEINGTKYESLQAAINAANTNDTVTLLADATEDVVINKDITLDLGGKTLTNTNAGKATVTIAKDATATVKNGSIIGGTSYYNIQNNGTATFEDVTATAGNTGSSMIDNWGTLTIESGTYEGGLNVVKSEEGSTLTINGGKFTLNYATNGYTAVILVYGDTTITGGEFIQSLTTTGRWNHPQVVATGVEEGYTAITRVTGGHFVNKMSGESIFRGIGKGTSDNFEVSGGTFNKSVPDSYFKTGYFAKKTADGYTADGPYAVRLGTAAGYATLEEAFAAAKSGDTITLLRDCESDRINLETKSITVDLNGKVLTSTAAYGVMFCAKNGHKITVKGTTAGSKLVGTLMVTAETDGRIEINGGTYESDKYCPIYINGAVSSENSKLTVKNATITALSGDSNQDNGVAVYLAGYSTSTFTKTTITAPVTGLEIRAGKLTLTNCTVTGGSGEVVTNANGNGTTVTNAAVAISQHTTKKDIDVTITGGTYTATAAVYQTNVQGTGSEGVKASIKSGTFKGAVSAETNNTVAVSGGSFSSAVPENCCAPGYIPTKNEDSTYGVKQGTYVAETKGVKYETLQAAIDAAVRNATVKMLADTRENVTIDKAMTLDLNGHTLNGGTVKGTPTLKIDTARVTVMDSSEAKTGTIMREDTAENSGVSSHYVIDIQGRNALLTFNSGNVRNNSGNADGSKGASLVRVGDDNNKKVHPVLTIAGGTFTQDNFIVIKVDFGTLHLKGGTVNSKTSYAVENWLNANIKGDAVVNGAVSSWTYSAGSNSTLEISGGTVNGNVESVSYDGAEGKLAKVKITGGTVNGTLSTKRYNNATAPSKDMATIEVTGGTFDRDPTKYVVEGSTVNANSDGTFGVAKAYLAKVGETSYYTMDEAFKAQTASGAPIVMLRDYTTGSTFNSGTVARVVDLRGHTWTCTGTDANSAAFEINNPNATLTVKNGKIVSSQLVGLIPSAMGGTIKYDNSSLTFENVEMSTTATSGIETNGNNTNDTVTLKNSTLNVPNGFGIYFPSSGTLTIDNSTINAKTMGVQVCAGSLSINEGSKITVTGDPVEKTENDGAIQDGAAISIVNRGYKPFGEIAITGGTFTAKAGNNAIKAYNWDNTNKVETTFTANDKVAVSGGTFSSAVPAGLCAEGYVPTEADANGNYTVEKVMVAQIGEVKYGTLAEAIAAANAGDTVKLLRDINTPEISYMISKSLTIDLNGKTVTGDGYDAVFQINNADAKVLIKNGNIVAVENTGSAGKYAMAIWACKAECEVTLENLNASQKITHTDDPQMDMIYASGGTIIINSGNFKSGTPAWTLNCKDAAYKDGTANIIVKGGTFTGFDPANNKAEGENTNFVAAGYKSVDNGDGTYTVIVNEAVVAVIGDKEYETLAAATTDAKAGDTIVLVADAKGEQFVVIMSGVTLNLNGHSITGATMFYASGEVIDTSATKGVVSATSYSMNLENTYTSIYDKEKSGYSFFDLTIQSGVKNVEGDANAKAVQFRLKKDTNAALAERNRAFELLKKGVDSSRVEARVTVTWTDGDTTQHLIFVFTDDFMAQYCNPTQAKLFQVIFSGLDSIQANSIKAVASFVTYDGNNNVTHITHGKTETIK